MCKHNTWIQYAALVTVSSDLLAQRQAIQTVELLHRIRAVPPCTRGHARRHGSRDEPATSLYAWADEPR